MVMTMIDYLDIKPEHLILDFGTAKGYVVKAFRMLRRQAWGVDYSQYAIDNVDPSIKSFCALATIPLSSGILIPHHFDLCIAKDVLEHNEKEILEQILMEMPAERVFSVIPIGYNGKYIAPANDLDPSHVICEGPDWWNRLFHSCNWKLEHFTFRINGIKDAYYIKYPESHGFFLHRRLK